MKTVKPLTPIENKFRKNSIIEKLSDVRQRKIYESLNGLKFSDLRKVIQKLHPLEEFVMVSNLLASMTNWNPKELAEMTHELVMEYGYDRISYKELEEIARTHSTLFFDKFEKTDFYEPNKEFKVNLGDVKYHEESISFAI